MKGDTRLFCGVIHYIGNRNLEIMYCDNKKSTVNHDNDNDTATVTVSRACIETINNTLDFSNNNTQSIKDALCLANYMSPEDKLLFIPLHNNIGEKTLENLLLESFLHYRYLYSAWGFRQQMCCVDKLKASLSRYSFTPCESTHTKVRNIDSTESSFTTNMTENDILLSNHKYMVFSLPDRWILPRTQFIVLFSCIFMYLVLFTHKFV